MPTSTLMALDVGEKRIGVALADPSIRIALPYETIDVDGNEIENILALAGREGVETLVIGYPRNQQGETTAQTTYVEQFAQKLEDAELTLVFQDESLTSVMAEQRLVAQKKPYSKGDIDKHAAAIILQDYLEQQ